MRVAVGGGGPVRAGLERVREQHGAVALVAPDAVTHQQAALAADHPEAGAGEVGLAAFEERGEGIQKVLRVHLRYAPGGRGRDPILMGIKRISKPGLRVYARSTAIPRVFGGLGTAILSTPQGVMSGTRARRLKVGGEVLAHVW